MKAISIVSVAIILISSQCTALNSTLQEIFTHVYEKNLWGDPDSHSGCGSNLASTKNARIALPDLCQQLAITTLLDAPCGDFFWMKEVNLDIKNYIGIDIVPEIINNNIQQHEKSGQVFIHADIVHDTLPAADLILCRDCLVHFDFNTIFLTLKNFKKSGAQYLLTTTYPTISKNRNILLKNGRWRPLNLQKPPFHFPKPILLIAEQEKTHDGHTKHLGLWRLDSIV